jgi:hypothetical protein
VDTDSPRNTRSETLKRAAELVTGDRNRAYGDPNKNLAVTADLWSTYLGTEIGSVDVAMMMILLKVGRTLHGEGSADTYIDIAGYAAIASELTNG